MIVGRDDDSVEFVKRNVARQGADDGLENGTIFLRQRIIPEIMQGNAAGDVSCANVRGCARGKSPDPSPRRAVSASPTASAMESVRAFAGPLPIVALNSSASKARAAKKKP